MAANISNKKDAAKSDSCQEHTEQGDEKRSTTSPIALSSNTFLTSKFLSIEPLSLVFNQAKKDSKECVKLSNISGVRVAWRIRTNSPTRYIVMPASGFLTPKETVLVNIELVDTTKYHKRQRFIVQAMEAKETEKDRKKIWEDERANKLDVVHTIRILTKMISAESPSSVECSRSESIHSNKVPADSPLQHTPSKESDKEYISNLSVLMEQVRVAMEEKVKKSQALVSTVNEVKKIEMELDRTGLQCKELHNKLQCAEAKCKALKEAYRNLEEQIKDVKAAGARCSMDSKI